MNLPRFSLEKFESAYCESNTTTGKSIFSKHIQYIPFVWDSKCEICSTVVEFKITKVIYNAALIFINIFFNNAVYELIGVLNGLHSNVLPLDIYHQRLVVNRLQK